MHDSSKALVLRSIVYFVKEDITIANALCLIRVCIEKEWKSIVEEGVCREKEGREWNRSSGCREYRGRGRRMFKILGEGETRRLRFRLGVVQQVASIDGWWVVVVDQRYNRKELQSLNHLTRGSGLRLEEATRIGGNGCGWGWRRGRRRRGFKKFGDFIFPLRRREKRVS